ncbi:MAG: hypothetical protein ACLGI2_06790 [Acidimicrobiia bacterium]
MTVPARTFATFLLVLALGACGRPEADRSESYEPPAADPAQVSLLPTTSAPVRAVPSRFEFVDYVVAGGIAGLDDHLRMYPDGRAVYDGGGRVVNFTVPQSTVDAVRTALEQADLAALPPVDSTVPGSADLRVYRVIFGGRSVRFHDGTMPAALGPAVELLDREVARAKAMR